MRTATEVVSVLAPVAAGLILIGLAGLALIARQSGRHSKLALTGLICAAAGMSALLLGGLIQAFLYGGDSPWMPFFVIPGILLVIVGVVLLAIFILRARCSLAGSAFSSRSAACCFSAPTSRRSPSCSQCRSVW